MALRTVDGSGVLYHFLQKDLIQSDVFFFQMLIARLVVALGIWFPPSLYAELPLLVAYAVRDPHSRGNRRLALPDQWGSPNQQGYFRDDNSLIKKVPSSLRIRSRLTDVYAGRAIGTGFVASHVWRQLNGEPTQLASRDPLTYSFVPNQVGYRIRSRRSPTARAPLRRRTFRRSPTARSVTTRCVPSSGKSLKRPGLGYRCRAGFPSRGFPNPTNSIISRQRASSSIAGVG